MGKHCADGHGGSYVMRKSSTQSQAIIMEHDDVMLGGAKLRHLAIDNVSGMPNLCPVCSSDCYMHGTMLSSEMRCVCKCMCLVAGIYS